MTTLLRVQDLASGYGRVPVLHGIRFEVAEGEILGILGHNGMGKSTLLKTLMGIVPATRGTMSYDGQDLGRLRSSGRAQLGIGDGLIRLSVGLEDVNDLKSDLDGALAAAI